MKRIVLASCVWKDIGPDRHEHLGLASLSSYLASKKIRSKVVDGNLTDISACEIAEEIARSRCRLAGFSVTRTNLEDSMKAASHLRKLNNKIHIVFGGHEPTLNYVRILNECSAVDSIVLGEGEYTLAGLSDRVLSGSSWHDIKGIAFRDMGGSIKKNPCRPAVEDLDALPFPDRRPYRSLLRRSRSAAIYSSRGCFGNCSYCGINLFYRQTPGRRWRARSARNVVDEIEILVKKYGINTVNFKDDDFIGPGRKGRERARGFGEEIIARGLDINFSFLCRPDTIDAGVLGFLMKAGLFHVSVGVESWNQRQLDLYNKRVTPSVNDRAIAVLEELGLDYTVYLILFDPYLTVRELINQIDKIIAVGLEHASLQHFFNRLRLSPASPLHERFRKDKLRSFEKLAGIPVQTVYDFVHPETREAYHLWEKIQPVYIRFFISHYKFFDINEMVHERIFLVELEAMLKKWILKRYKDFLNEIISRQRKSYAKLINKYFTLIDKKIRYIHSKLKSFEKSGGARIGFAIDDEVIRYPFETKPKVISYYERLMDIRKGHQILDASRGN